MLDYEKDVKEFAINKLAGDIFGKGRVESAIYHTFAHVYQKGVAEGNARIATLQARIDALMWEYCPDEMTPEQIAEWERHQKAVDDPSIP